MSDRLVEQIADTILSRMEVTPTYPAEAFAINAAQDIVEAFGDPEPRMRVHKEDGVNWVAEDECEKTWCDTWEAAMQAAYGHVCWGHEL